MQCEFSFAYCTFCSLEQTQSINAFTVLLILGICQYYNKLSVEILVLM